MNGLLLTLISVVSPIKFIAPGAVMIAGYADRNRMGRTAFAGPLVNIAIASGLLTLLPMSGSRGGLYSALLAGAAINAFLALFNLIPFTVFDGRKVFEWNKLYWIFLFMVALGMTFYTSFVLHPF